MTGRTPPSRFVPPPPPGAGGVRLDGPPRSRRCVRRGELAAGDGLPALPACTPGAAPAPPPAIERGLRAGNAARRLGAPPAVRRRAAESAQLAPAARGITERIQRALRGTQRTLLGAQHRLQLRALAVRALLMIRP